jgi:dihydrofolate reductase
MGRKTYESIGRNLPDRTNIIVSRNPEFKAEGAFVCKTIEEAIEQARKSGGSDEIFIIGGAQIFEKAIIFADKLYITKVNSEAPAADAFFPDYSDFKKVLFSEKHMEDGLEYEFAVLEK